MNVMISTVSLVLVYINFHLVRCDINNVKEKSSFDLKNFEPSIKIECTKSSMIITLQNIHDAEKEYFSGMIYPKGLPSNSSCLSQYRKEFGSFIYKLPLRSCNTMFQENDEGEVEFFNTIVVQPHLKLVTDMGRGFHVRCKYKHRETMYNPKKIEQTQNEKDSDSNNEIEVTSMRRNFARSFKVSNNEFAAKSYIPDENETSMPHVVMKIYSLDKIADKVKIGDPLKLLVKLDEQNHFTPFITNCIVRDGIGWGEQTLIDEDGCPTDQEIMGSFKYAENKMSASVVFPAHKFPYTISVYYQCNVNLCPIDDSECYKEPKCNEVNRRRRQITKRLDDDGIPATIEVFSGLYVNDNTDLNENSDGVTSEKAQNTSELCVSQRTFAIAIAAAGLLLMLLIIASLVWIMSRNRSKLSPSESSIYSGPYTNTAFSQNS